MCLLPSNYAGNEEEAVIEAINNSLMHNAIVTTRIAIRNTDNTNVGYLNKIFFLVLYSFRCSLGRYLLATDHVVVGARFI